MPSYSELADIFGYKSKWGAQSLAKKLLERGIFKKDEKGRLLPGKYMNALKVLGNISAGWPSPAEEENIDTISLDEWLISNREASFMLKVSGDSMVEAGIMHDDLIIIQRGKQPKNGDIVVAEVDNEWTVKYFHKKGRNIELRPANKKYKPIKPKQELKIAGIVTANIRKY